MKNKFIIAVLSGLLLPWQLSSQTRDVTIIIHLRGVYESKISLLSRSGTGIYKPIAEVPGLKNGERTSIAVSKEKLPGDFVLRFDYKEKETSTPYPSEKSFFINDQDLELWVRPEYCNNADSTHFQDDEKENAAFAEFSKENSFKKEKLGLLQNFLMNYDDTGSKFYKEGTREYEKRRQEYNQWLTSRYQQDKDLFISNMYPFQYVPLIPWNGTPTDRLKSLISHYFDGMDFKNPALIKISDLGKWMDQYVNLYGQLSTSVTLRDSLFPLAGITAIEKAKQGDPLVYGWMVDYFFRGYETNGITAGMKILEPYMNDPNCLTSKRQEIARRLKGMESLVAGSQAPGISMKDPEGNLFELDTFETQYRYLLILFWSAGCSHCVELADNLYPWQQQAGVHQKIKTIAISLDETEQDITAWRKKMTKFPDWKHLHDAEGVRSKVAGDYYVLATPVMILLDAKTREIVALPNSLSELMNAVK